MDSYSTQLHWLFEIVNKSKRYEKHLKNKLQPGCGISSTPHVIIMSQLDRHNFPFSNLEYHMKVRLVLT
jgi:hypothetical protein